MHDNIESHLVEKRVFKPAKAFCEETRESKASRNIGGCIASRSASRRNSGRAKRASWSGAKRWKKVLEWKAPFAKWFVGGKLNVSENCLDRHLDRSAPKQGGDYLGRRTRRQTHAHLSTTASRSLPFRECAEAKQHQQRRSRHHLSADDSGGGHRHARLRADRRGALGCLRRIQRRQHSRSDCRLRRDRGHHSRWRLSARRDCSAEEKCR